MEGFRRYADFTGRSNRSDYWRFGLARAGLLVLAAMLDSQDWFALQGHALPAIGASFTVPSPLFLSVGPQGYAYRAVEIATLLPSFAVAVRRLHDFGWSGWLVLSPVAGWAAMLPIAYAAGLKIHFSGPLGRLVLNPDGTQGLTPASILCLIVLACSFLPLLAVAFRPGDPGPNRFGPAPRAAPSPSAAHS